MSIHFVEDAAVIEADSASRLEWLFPPAGETSTLTVECRRQDYSASLIARAVEDSDAHLLNMNVTAGSEASRAAGRVTVELRVDHRSPLQVERSLERYGFTVTSAIDATGSGVDSTLRERVNELLRLIENE